MSKGGGPDAGRSRCSQNAGLAIITAVCVAVLLDRSGVLTSLLSDTTAMAPPGDDAHTFTFGFTELPHGGRHFRVMRAAGREGARVLTSLVTLVAGFHSNLHQNQSTFFHKTIHNLLQLYYIFYIIMFSLLRLTR